MKKQGVWAVVLAIMIVFVSSVSAETTEERYDFTRKPVDSIAFPNLSDEPSGEALTTDTAYNDVPVNQALWPFSKKDENKSGKKPKSTRKAFFLSLLVPGLGETYVGSKRGLLFLGVEAVAWWMYLTNTSDGYDVEDEFRVFADEHWHYTDDASLGHSYWDWLIEKKYVKDDTVGPNDFDKIREELEDNADISVHHYSGQGSQQDYEMIGKYPQFVYGWEDIVEHNSTLQDQDDKTKFNNNFSENISNIESSLREEYEDMRYDSNKKLKAGQRGIHIMIVNRILSAIDAGRLAYHHNKSLESELSTVRMRLVQKRILDNNVTMLTLTKKF